MKQHDWLWSAPRLFLVAGLLAGVGCGGESPSIPNESTDPRAASQALEYGSDLIITELRAPASVRPGESFTATIKVCNQGTAPATNYYSGPYVELYLSTRSTLSQPGSGSPPPTWQSTLASVQLPGTLDAGQCVTAPLSAYTYLPPEAQGDGAYYLGAIVDVWQGVQELREDNNAFVSGLIGVGNRPDLVVTAVSGPASVRNSESFTANVTVCNQGTTPTSYYGQARVELLLSTDDSLSMSGSGTPPPMDQVVIGSLQLDSLDVGQCVTRPVSAYATLPPAAQSDGAYFLGAIADASNGVQELREDNNTRASGPMGVGNRSDLVISELSGPTSVRPGELVTATIKVCNQGTMPTSYSRPRLELYLSKNATLTLPSPGSPPPADQVLLTSVDLDFLDVKQCVTRTLSGPAYPPPGAPPEGAYYLGAIVDSTRIESELREDNNTRVGALVGVGYRPDLVVTQVSGPASARPGDPFTATVKVCNQGTTATSSYTPPRLELYLSTDTALSFPSTSPGSPWPRDQMMIGSLDVSPLDAGQCVTLSVPAYASLPPDALPDGTLYLGAIVDTSSTQVELREDNNTFIAGLMGVGYRADLVVTQVSGPASARPGDPFTATVTVCNQGTTTSNSYGSTAVELYLSTDTELTLPPSGPGSSWPRDQSLIGSMTVDSLMAGQCVTRQIPAHVSIPPDALPDSALYLGAIVDPYRSETELREDNNTRVSGLMGVGNRPDLVVTQVRGPASARPGDLISATVTVCNQGTTSSSSSFGTQRLELYLSTDQELSFPQTGPGSSWPRDQSFVGSVDLQPLDPGQCVTRTASGPASLPPDALPDSALYLGALVDVTQAVMELREDNNAAIGGLIGVGNRSDLVVTELRGPASVRSGNTFTATVKVCNQGTAPVSGSSWPRLELYLSSDDALSFPPTGPGTMPRDQLMIGSKDVAPLQAGQCATYSLVVNAYPPPDGPIQGALYLGAIVDPYRSETELREDNNAFIGGLIGVGNQPDLVVTQVSAPASVRSGNSFTANVTVCNQGTTTSGSSPSPARLELYLSTDTVLTSPTAGLPAPYPRDQTMIGSLDLDPLEAGQCVTRAVSASSYLPPDALPDSALYLGAIVDTFRSVTELREDNNVYVGGLIGVGNRSDLVVKQVTAPASVRTSESFTATVQVCNQGTTGPTGPSGQARVELYLSTDDVLSLPPTGPGSSWPRDQAMIGSVDVPIPGAGQCVTRTVSVWPALPPDGMPDSAFYLGAIVDPYRSEPELREDNNAFVGGLVGVGNRSDLVVKQVTGPASVRPGDPFTASVQVCNQGTAPSNGSYSAPRLELYLSTDGALTYAPTGPGSPWPRNQSLVGTLDLPPLDPGQCVTRSVPAWASLPPDALPDSALYLGAIVDAYRSELELREDNNLFAGAKMGVGMLSDLIITEVSAPASVRPGNSFSATVKVCNQGTGPGGYGMQRLELYLSMDDVLSPPATPPGSSMPRDQMLIGGADVPSLPAGQCTTVSVPASAYLPADAMGRDGAYFLGAIIDPYQYTPELREDNNMHASVRLGVGNQPDYVVTQVTGPASARNGAAFSTTVQVCNQGTVRPSSGPSRLELYLSTDDLLTTPTAIPGPPPPTDQTMVGSVDVPALDPSQCTTVTVLANAYLPPDAMGLDGAYYLGAIVNVAGTLQELRTDNNTRVAGLMGVGNAPDLTVSTVSGPASVRPGNAFTATVKACNQGTLSTSAWSNTVQLEVYISSDTVLSLPPTGPGPAWPKDQMLVGSMNLPPLSAGQCVTVSVPASAYVPPDSTAPGTFYLGAIVNPYPQGTELRRDNNTRADAPLVVAY